MFCYSKRKWTKTIHLVNHNYQTSIYVGLFAWLKQWKQKIDIILALMKKVIEERIYSEQVNKGNIESWYVL